MGATQGSTRALGGKGDVRGEHGPETLVVFVGGSRGGKYRVDRFRTW